MYPNVRSLLQLTVMGEVNIGDADTPCRPGNLARSSAWRAGNLTESTSAGSDSPSPQLPTTQNMEVEGIKAFRIRSLYYSILVKTNGNPSELGKAFAAEIPSDPGALQGFISDPSCGALVY